MDDVIAVYRKVERTLRHLTVIAERAREGIAVFDLNGVIQFVNAAWAVMHGYKRPDELIGKQISEFHTEKHTASDAITFIEEAKQRGQFAGRLEHVRRDGTSFSTEMLMVVFNDEEGKTLGLVGFATDFTEQENTENELRRYRCHLAELVKQQTKELEATKSELQCQIKEHEQAGQKLKLEIAELSAANERLREQIHKNERAKDDLKQYHDKLEQRLKQQSDELTAATARLRDEIARHKQQEEYFKQQTDAIRATGERLQAQIDELSTGGSTDESDTLKARNSVKEITSITDNEKAMLENVFRQNIVLQKPKLDSAAQKDS